jgi:hypothetical protein
LKTNCLLPCGTSASSGTTTARFAHGEHHARPREHAGLAARPGVVDAGAHQQRAAVGVDLRIDRLDRPLKLRPAGVDRHLDRLARRARGQM